MIPSLQAVRPRCRAHVSRAAQRQALVPLATPEFQRLALIRGYQAMAWINRDITRLFTPLEEEAERRLRQFRQTH